jgi:DNA-binding CsgD family transcriptional regulator
MAYEIFSDDPFIILPEFLQHHLLDSLNDLLQDGVTNTFYQGLLSLAINCCPSAQAGSVLTRQPDTNYGFIAACGYQLSKLRQFTLPLDESLLTTSAGETVFLLHDMDRYNANHMDAEHYALLVTYGRIKEIQETLCVTVWQSGVIAVIVALDNFERRSAFSTQEVALVQMLGALTGVMVEALGYKEQLTAIQALHAAPPGAAHPANQSVNLLTTKEQKVLHLLKAGKSNKQIASQLGVAPETVKKHLSHIYQKLGVTNRTQATSYAGVVPQKE